MALARVPEGTLRLSRSRGSQHARDRSRSAAVLAPEKGLAEAAGLTRQPRKLPFSAILDEAVSEAAQASELLFLYSVPLGPGGLLAGLAQDVGSYPFLRGERRAISGATRATTYTFTEAHSPIGTTTQRLRHFRLRSSGPKRCSCYRRASGSGRICPPSRRSACICTTQIDQPFSASSSGRSVSDRARTRRCASYIPTYWWHLVSTRGRPHIGRNGTYLVAHAASDSSSIPRFPAGRAAARALVQSALARARALAARPERPVL